MVRLLAAALLLTACNGQAQPTSDAAPDPSCTYVDASSCSLPSPSFQNDVLPVLDRTCNSTCHAPGQGQWPLTTATDVSDWGSLIYADLEQCSMPPPDASAGNGNLTNAERAMILDWLACAAVDAGTP